MISFHEPLSPNLPSLHWNLNTSQTKDKNDVLIGARYIPYTIWLVRVTYHSVYANIELLINLIKKLKK